MSRMLYGSIDLKKIDKSKIVQHQNGSLYYPVVVWVNDAEDTYGNIASIQQGQTKEERQNNEAKTYIGNLRDAKAQDVKSNSGQRNNDPDPFEELSGLPF